MTVEAQALRMDAAVAHAPGFSVTRVARGATYEISVTNSGARGSRARLVVDGAPIDGTLVPYAEPGSRVRVEVTL